MDMQKDKNNKRFGIKGVIVSISAVPVLIVGIIVTIFASLTMRAGVEDQVFKGLNGIATSAEYAPDTIESVCSFRTGRDSKLRREDCRFWKILNRRSL